MSLDIASIRAGFPVLHQQVNDHPLIYLDNAATTQKPQAVIDAVSTYYQCDNANVHRGAHRLSERATAQYEAARKMVQTFIHAAHVHEIIFTKGTTDAINLVAASYGQAHLNAGDEVLITALEHHSNLVPWQLICQQTGATLKVAPISEQGEVILETYYDLLSSRTKIVAINHISNALGTVNPVKTMTAKAHEVGAVVLVDGAQAIAHTKVDVQALDCDFYAASAHKVYGPTGVGFLYGKTALLEAMPPYQGGGEMIQRVTFEQSTYAPLPYKFEAGTPNIAGVIGLGTALQYLQSFSMTDIAAYEQTLLDYATEKAEQFEGLRIIGTAKQKASILSFVLEGIHAHDVGTILDAYGVAVRAGHHCAMPVMTFFNVAATVRASFAFYNTKEDIDQLFAALYKVKAMFHG